MRQWGQNWVNIKLHEKQAVVHGSRRFLKFYFVLVDALPEPFALTDRRTSLGGDDRRNILSGQ